MNAPGASEQLNNMQAGYRTEADVSFAPTSSSVNNAARLGIQAIVKQ